MALYLGHNKIIRLKDYPKLKNCFAVWFHEKWGIPLEAYSESMDACLNNVSAIPQWYGVLKQSKVIAGLGVIANDFHNRKDLTPNLCALYVEEQYRCQGIAGELLSFVVEDMKKLGKDILYLITDHTSFYERYGWEYVCMVQGDGETYLTRMYIHKASPENEIKQRVYDKI